MDQSSISDGSARPEEWGRFDHGSCRYCSMLTVETIAPRLSRDPKHEFASKAFHDQCTKCQAYDSYPTAACNFCKHLRLGHWSRCILPSLQNECRAKKPISCVELDVSNHFAQRPERDCDLCRLFQSSSQHPVRKLAVLKSYDKDDKDDLKILLWGDHGGHRARSTIAVQATESASFTPHMQLPKEVNWDTVKSWCLPPSKVSGLPVGFRVIDLDKRCLVEPLDPSEYVTLSYVWGESIESHEELQATKDNIELLKTPGVLSRFRLPATIRDAITVCQELGFHYLWVDRLCIVQDDQNNEYNKDDQINDMDQIYESSRITIVAASGGSARDGLAGISRHRDHHHPVLRWEELELMASFPFLDTILAETTWNSRGWTFQEQICANTAMFFTDHGVFAVFHRDGLYTRSIRTESPRKYEDMSEIPATYFAGVEEYTRRSLTLHTDILYAFNGAARRLNCGQDIIYGIPLQLFDDAILWQPAQWNREVRPPDISGKQTFPSWAWCSLYGPVTYRSPGVKNMDGICASLASWAFPGPAGALIPVPFAPFMLECPDDHHHKFFWAHAAWHVNTMNFAWREGFFKKEYFTSERRDQHRGPFEGGMTSTIQGIWRECLRSVPKDRVCHSGNTDPVFLSSFSTEDKMRAWAKPGRILVFTQRASLELEYLSTVAFKRVFALWSPNGRWMGLIGLTRSIADMHFNSIQAGGRLQMEFLALSITSDYDTIWATAKELNMNIRRRNDGTWEPRTGGKQEKENIDGWVEREGIRSTGGMDYQINNMAGEHRDHYDSWAMHEAEVSFTNRGQELHRPSFVTTDDTLARVNVMLISQKDGVARRLGVGQVYMKRWKEAEREFCTAVLE